MKVWLNSWPTFLMQTHNPRWGNLMTFHRAGVTEEKR